MGSGWASFADLLKIAMAEQTPSVLFYCLHDKGTRLAEMDRQGASLAVSDAEQENVGSCFAHETSPESTAVRRYFLVLASGRCTGYERYIDKGRASWISGAV
ncbi:hypothetical protein DEM27_32360 [Metarhizobium album]|uniref:Uncharacterized protein n=1 Tax=Metarhizobium album TaxID=2182425 RepID=A0A2U2DFT9_9HYPH|nr:hypothetical protein DEM27_32360 [Rhizobium album]